MTFLQGVISTKKQWWSKNSESFTDRESVIRNPSSCCWLEWLLLPDFDDSIDHRALADGWVAKQSIFEGYISELWRSDPLIWLASKQVRRGSEGEWISPDQSKSIRGRRVPGTKKCRDSDYVRICFFVIDERYSDVWHIDSNCLVTTQQLPRAKPA